MLNPQEEAKREQLKAKCREMKVLPPSDIFIGLQVHEKGKLIFEDVQRGHSWTRNYWNYIYGKTSNCGTASDAFGVGYISHKDTNGTLWYSHYPILYIPGTILTGGANTLGGISVGTGTAAFSVEQYALDALIESGSSAGKLYYNASAVSSTTYAAKAWTIVGSRIFNNNSGGSIVVAETGVCASYYDVYWLLDRSLLSPTVTVPAVLF